MSGNKNIFFTITFKERWDLIFDALLKDILNKKCFFFFSKLDNVVSINSHIHVHIKPK